MLMSRALSRASRSVLLSAPKHLQTPSNSLVCESPNKLIANNLSLLDYSNLHFDAFRRFGISSSASPQPSEKEHGTAVDSKGQDARKDADSGEVEVMKESGFDLESQNIMSQSDKRRKASKRTAFSDSDSESDGDISMADMVKLVEEKEELLDAKQKEIEQMKDKVVRTLAEMENVMARTRRDAENTKKFAIQNFAKGLLDVADNLGRASAHVKGSFSKIDESKDTAGAVPLLKTLLEGVAMTEKQLGEVFKKFGVEKFDPTNEPFDPHRHNAVFQVPDNSKPSGTVAHVLKAGYMLYDRVIRPAEVGVSQASVSDAAENNTSDKRSSDA